MLGAASWWYWGNVIAFFRKMSRSEHASMFWRSLMWNLVLVLWLPLSQHAASAEVVVAGLVGKEVIDVQVYRDGQASDDGSILELIETRVGQPLSLRQVRESLVHLFSLGDLADVRVSAAEEQSGVCLRYDLVLVRPGPSVEVRGASGSQSVDVQSLIASRFGQTVPTDRIPTVAGMLKELYRESGHYATKVVARLEQDGGRLIIDIDEGPIASIGKIELTGDGLSNREEVLEQVGLQPGALYDPDDLGRSLAEYEEQFRSRRYYEAEFGYQAIPSQDGLVVDLLLDIQTGPPVTIIFDQDLLPGGDFSELVPVAREGSIDEDLLEDSSLRIVTHLQRLGYRDALVKHERVEKQDQLQIIFDIEPGSRYELAEINFSGNQRFSTGELLGLFGVARGQPLVTAEVDDGISAITQAYRQLGYRLVAVSPTYEDSGTEAFNDPFSTKRVDVGVEVVEGQVTKVGRVAFEGVTAFNQDDLASQVVQPRAPYYEASVGQGVSALRLRYLNEGYETVRVEAVPSFDEVGTTANVTFFVKEGRQVLVDHVLVVGNRQISASTVRGELLVGSGQPFGRDDVDETRRRLTSLGLFRRIDLREFSHGDRAHRDLVIVVEESPSTRVGYGAGVEAAQRLRATQGGAASERLVFAPRGFFEVGRRNLWGKNRSIDLFTRASLLRRFRAGSNEYRLLLNYREPRVFSRSSDLLISGFVEQVIRPSFDLFSRGINVDLRNALGQTITGRAGYTYGVNRVTNEQLKPKDRPLVDRLFPDVTLSIVSGGLLRDTRTDPLEPTNGSLLAADLEAAFREMGSEVGFAKSVLQGFLYRQLPGELVFAAGVRVGLARGFSLTLPAVTTLTHNVEGLLVRQAGSKVNVIQDLPASERFFAGGDSTVRGFALDRLGDGSTIDANGFPTGGNAMIVLNSELRVPVTEPLQVVGFVDAGNVFDRVSHVRLGRLRGAAGFGVRYGSPIGPIRVDLGFNLDRREFSGQRESLTAFHFSIGQAF
ncbi:MAG: hypothetical protein CL484_10695 [Acidobacteria bacterium]|nr:hypothetical protein [Acidobacteriota bacterium]